LVEMPPKAMAEFWAWFRLVAAPATKAIAQ
jgi:hypothetical protein